MQDIFGSRYLPLLFPRDGDSDIRSESNGWDLDGAV